MKWLIWILLFSPSLGLAKARFGLRELDTVLKKSPGTGKPVASLEELIPFLPEDLRSNFTFVYHSRSPHGGLGNEADSAVSYDFPRVVLFSDDARMLLAFTGNAAKPGYDEVEAIHFDDPSRSFQFARYVLPAAVKKNPTLAKLATHNGETNPAECLRCHGADPRPVTDSYPLWPGFYGSVRDTFPKDSPELPFYRKFLKTQKTAKTGVYRLLRWPKGSSVTPYLDPKKYNPNTVEEGLTEFRFLPNTRMGMALTELNRKRIQRKMKSSPKYELLKYAILSGFLGCSLLPVSQAQVDNVYTELVSENSDRIKRLGTVPVGPGSTDLNMMEIGFYGNVIQLVYLARALDLDRSDWSMAFEPNSLSYFDGILSSIYEDKDFYLKEDILLEMLRDVSESDPKFRPFFKPYSAYRSLKYPFGERLDLGAALRACPSLVKRAKDKGSVLPEIPTAILAAVSSAKVEPVSAQAIAKKLQLSAMPYARCTNCHEGDSAIFTGRKIPFQNPPELKERLKQRSTSSEKPLYDEILHRVKTDSEGHMPPHGDALTAGEIENLEKYLSEVMRG